jgi:hypothetical protein
MCLNFWYAWRKIVLNVHKMRCRLDECGLWAVPLQLLYWSPF